MFTFNYDAGASAVTVWLVWIAVFAVLFILNEISRRNKYCGFACFVVLPVILSVLWFTVLGDTAYTDWFHLAKVYSSTAGCIGFWCIRYLHGTSRKTGRKWRLADSKIALCFPPLILAVNICEAVARDFEVGRMYSGVLTRVEESNQVQNLIGGSWNYMNAVAGILNIVTIVGWFGICLRKETAKDKSRDMLWPGMMWFWIVAYDLWNFAYTYNCLPGHAWYCGFALLLAPTVCAFTIGKGAWLQHRAHTLALWCMFAQTFPAFIDQGRFAVDSSHNETALFFVSLLALAANAAVLVFMIYKAVKRKCSPYTCELYDDMAKYREVKELAD